MRETPERLIWDKFIAILVENNHLLQWGAWRWLYVPVTSASLTDRGQSLQDRALSPCLGLLPCTLSTPSHRGAPPPLLPPWVSRNPWTCISE